MKLYADHYRMGIDEAEDFFHIIRSMDKANSQLTKTVSVPTGNDG